MIDRIGFRALKGKGLMRHFKDYFLYLQIKINPDGLKVLRFDWLTKSLED